MSEVVKKDTNVLNTQFNINIETELNAIAKLSPELATRAMDIIEKSIEYKQESDNKILELERNELEIRKYEIEKNMFLSSVTVFSIVIISLGSIALGGYLTLEGNSDGAIFSFIVAILTVLPSIIYAIKSKKE